MDGDKERTEGAEEEDDDKRQKSADEGTQPAGKGAVRKEDAAVAVEKLSSAKEQKAAGGRAPPPVPLRASAQKPKDLPLKGAAPAPAPAPSTTRGREQVEKAKAGRPPQRDPAKAAMKQGRSADQGETRPASKSPCRKRETSPRLTTRKEPSPKRVTAEPKSPLSQRRADASARHGSCQDGTTGRDEARGGRSPRDDKAGTPTPSPGGSPKRVQQTSGSRRTSAVGSDGRRAEEQLKVSPQRRAKSPADARGISPSSRGSPGAKRKVPSPRPGETSSKQVPKSKASSYRQKERDSSESLQDERTKDAVPKTKCKPSEEVSAPKLSVEAPGYTEQEAKGSDSAAASQGEKSEDRNSTPKGTAESGHDQPTQQTSKDAGQNTATPQFERGSQHISETPQEQQETGNITEMTETKELPKVNSVPEHTKEDPSLPEQNRPQDGEKTQNVADTTLSEIKQSGDKRSTSKCVTGEIGSITSAGETALSTKEALTLRNNAIQTYYSETHKPSDKLQNVTGAADDGKQEITDFSQADYNTSELLTLERKKKDEKNSTIKALPEARNGNLPETMHKTTVANSLRRSESEKYPSEKKKRVHSDSSVRNKRDRSAGRIFEETEEKKKSKNKSEKTQEDKFQVDSLHEKLLQGEGAIRKIANADTMKSDSNLSSPTRKTLRTKVPDGYQELVTKEKVKDEKLQRSENRDVYPDNDAKCSNKLTNKHLKNVNGTNSTLTSSPKSKYSATYEPRTNNLNGHEQPQKFDTHGHAQISGPKETQVEDETSGCGGLQGRKCPVYFGVKSYLHQFYDSAPSRPPPYEDYLEDEDDFEYMVDPAKRRKSCCSQGLWFRAGIWGGANLLLIGMIAMLVGHLTPPRQVVLETGYDLEVLDRTAIAFNHRLELCRLVGLGVFCCGGMVLLVTLLVSTIKHAQREPVMPVAPLVEPFEASPSATKIPITERIKPVQPTIWPQSATVRDGSLVVQMP